MRNNNNCISKIGIIKCVLSFSLIILCDVIFAQQSPSIQSGVTFQWADTQSNNSDPATIQSVTIDGTLYNTFVVPTSYEMTQLGPDGHGPNKIKQNGANVGGNSGQANWVSNATSTFQDTNLNHYFNANPNGRDICTNFNAALSTDAQKQTIFYSPAIPANEGGVLAVTERGGNNCFYIELWGIPPGGGPEQKLGETFVRNSGNYQNCTFGPPINGSDYWRSGRCNENGQTIAIGLFYLSDIAPTGSQITRTVFVAATRDHGDGKFFILQKYAVDQNKVNCVDIKISGDIHQHNNVPDGSTYSLLSGPSPAGQSFTLNSDGTYSYVPSLGFTGDVTFDYEVCLPAPNSSVCDSATVTLTFVPLPADPSFTVGCGSTNDYSITVDSPIGPEFEYSIDGVNFQDSPIFNGLSPGSYNLIVRNKFVGCTTTFSSNPIQIVNSNPTISVPSEITIEGCSAADITSATSVFELNEYGSNDVQSIFSINGNYNVSDNSGIDSVTYNDVISTSDDCPAVVIRTFTVTNVCGNTATASQTITIQDTTPPTLSIPADITIECDQDIPPISDIIQSESIINSSNYSITNSEYEVTAWFKPVNSNSYSPRNFDIPNNLGFGVDGNISGASGELGANATGTEVIRVDFSDPQLYINVTFGWKNPNEDALLTFYLNNQQVGTTKRHYGGNDSVNNPIIFTTDNGDAFDRVEFTAPYEPGDSDHDYLIHTITFKKVAPVFEAATAHDTCGLVTISGSDSETNACGNTKTVIRTWTATDVCGNSVSQNQTITVVDTTPPTFTVPVDITIECDLDPNDLSITGDVTDEADNCSTGLEATFSDETVGGNCPSESVITRTWILIDECNNESTATQTITIEDTTAPTFNEALPADVTVECDAVPTAETLTASDNCGNATVTFNETNTAGACANAYTLTRTWTATDECGLTTVHAQTITVQDTIAPVPETIPSTLTFECDDISNTPINPYCSRNEVTVPYNGGGNQVRITFMTRIDEANGDVIGYKFRLRNERDVPVTNVQVRKGSIVLYAIPTLSANTEIWFIYANPIAGVSVFYDGGQKGTASTNDNNPTTVCDSPLRTDYTATDNCDGTVNGNYTDTTTDNGCDNNYIINRVWTFTDSCGNTSTVNQTINIQDTTAPTFNEALPADVTVECDAVPTAETLTASDNCGNATVTFDETNTAGACAGEYTLTRTWTATDECGLTT
ncbi:Ig-like domain-containing protein, partial [Winogradskyella sp.]